jgi:hypothetical protein
MLKTILFAVAPMMLVASSVMADDSLLARVAKMDLTNGDSFAANVADADELGQADVEALLGDGEEPNGEEAIAACFRRIGYGYRRGYGHRSYGCYGYRSFHRPCYRTYYSYPSISCYRPVCHNYYTPVYNNYWGCW